VPSPGLHFEARRFSIPPPVTGKDRFDNEFFETLLDFDHDGRPDVVVAWSRTSAQGFATLQALHNDGGGTFIDATASVFPGGVPSLTGARNLVVADFDGDGLPDLVVGQFQDAVAWYRNTGKAGPNRFVLVDSAIVRLPRGSNAVPELFDIDGDGDLDLFIGDASGRIAFFRNDGTPRSPRFTLVTDDYLGGQRVGRRAVPRFVDLDGDGRSALIVGSEQGGAPAVFRGLVRDSSVMVQLPPYSAPAFVDVRGIGVRDLFGGGAGGGLVYFRRVDTFRSRPS